MSREDQLIPDPDSRHCLVLAPFVRSSIAISVGELSFLNHFERNDYSFYALADPGEEGGGGHQPIMPPQRPKFMKICRFPRIERKHNILLIKVSLELHDYA